MSVGLVVGPMTEVTPLPKAKKRRKPRPSTNRAAARKVWGQIVRARGVCEYADKFGGKCDGRHEAAHVIRARFSGTFTDLDNGRCLCAKHHSFVDLNPAEMIRFVGEDEYQRLWDKAQAWTANRPSPSTFWREERERLTDLKQRLEGL